MSSLCLMSINSGFNYNFSPALNETHQTPNNVPVPTTTSHPDQRNTPNPKYCPCHPLKFDQPLCTGYIIYLLPQYFDSVCPLLPRVILPPNLIKQNAENNHRSAKRNHSHSMSKNNTPG